MTFAKLKTVVYSGITSHNKLIKTTLRVHFLKPALLNTINYYKLLLPRWQVFLSIFQTKPEVQEQLKLQCEVDKQLVGKACAICLQGLPWHKPI